MRFGLGKRNAIGILTILAVFTFFIGGVAPAKAATTTYTLQVKQTADEDGANAQGPFTLKVYLTPVSGSTYFVVHGQVTGITGGTAYLGGTARVVSSNLILNLTMTEYNSTDKDWLGATMEVKVNKTSMKGTYWYVGSKFKGSSVFKDKFSKGTVTK